MEASAISVFNLICRIFELRDEFECLAPLAWKMDLNALCPFNFHKLEAVRYSYNLLIFKALSQKEHNLQVPELQDLHSLTVQSLAMETSNRLVELLLKVLARVVRAFPSKDPAECERLVFDPATQ